MDNPMLATAIALAAEQEDILSDYLEISGMSRSTLTAKIMIRSTEDIPIRIMEAAIRLDAYTRLINLEQRMPEPDNWTAQDYVDALLPKLYSWLRSGSAEAVKSYYIQNNVHDAYDVFDQELFQGILLHAIANQLVGTEENLDSREQTFAVDGGGSSKPGNDNNETV